MTGLLDYTRWMAAGIALAFFVIGQTTTPNNSVTAAFIDQPLSTLADTYVGPALNTSDVPSWVPQVSFLDSSMAVGETVGVPIMLSGAPEGLAGYHLRVDLGDAATARIVGVEFPEFGMVYEQAGIGDSVRLAAVDLFHTAESNATNLTLAVVKLEGVSEGSFPAQLTVMQIDDDEGNTIPITVYSGTVSVY